MNCFSKIAALSVAAWMLALPSAQAQVTYNFNISNPISVTDGTYSATVDAVPDLASVQSISINIQHDSTSDLTVTLTPPGGSPFVLFDQIATSASENSSALGAASGANKIPQTYTFVVPPTGSDLTQASLAVADNISDFWLPSGTPYNAQTWQNGPFPSGTWTMNVTDNDPTGSEGAWYSAQFTGTPVPEPKQTALAAGILLIGAMIVRRMRRPGPTTENAV